MDILNFVDRLRFDEQLNFKMEIPQQWKPNGAFAQLPEMPGNPFFERINMVEQGGHVYRAKQRCWYSLTTIIGPMDGGDYLPTAVHGEPSEQNLVDEPLTAHAWMSRDDDRWVHGGHHLHHWHGGEIAAGGSIYIGTAPWNPDSILIPDGFIILSVGVGDIIPVVIGRLNQLLGIAPDNMEKLFGQEAGINATNGISVATLDKDGERVGIVFDDNGRIARFERVQPNPPH